MNFLSEPHFIQLLSGISISISLLLCSIILGFILSVTLTLGSYAKHCWIVCPIRFYTFFIRGTPLLVQIFIIYYGCSQFTWLRESIFWIILKSPFSCAVIALAINSSAYSIVLFRGAIAAVSKNEIDACFVLGMSKWLALHKVILPRILRTVLPAYSNEVIILLKSTALASTITLMDITGITNKLISQTYAPLFWLGVAGCVYLFFNIVITQSFKTLEKNLDHT